MAARIAPRALVERGEGMESALGCGGRLSISVETGIEKLSMGRRPSRVSGWRYAWRGIPSQSPAELARARGPGG
jgi:hypothetical protein